MTHRAGSAMIVNAETPQQCDECGEIRELRPYGKDGACICHPCANKSIEAQTTARAAFLKRFD